MNNLNVLVLEDDPSFLQSIIAHFDDNGSFNCFAFRTYNEALEKYEELKKNKEKLHLLVVDIFLELDNKPYGGLEFAAYVNKYHLIPTVILSSHFEEPEYSQKKVWEFELNTKYYFPKTYLSSDGMFMDQIWAAIHDFQKYELSVSEYLLHVSKKIGILDNRGIYQFYSKDEIIYLTSDDKYTSVFLTEKRRCTISASIGKIGPLIQYNYPNIRPIGQSYWVNFEKFISFNMLNEGGRQNNPKLTLEEGHEIISSRKNFQILFSEGLLIQPKTKN